MKKYIHIFLFIVFAIIVLVKCKKEPETPGGNKIEIGQSTIDTVEYATASIKSIVGDLGGNEIIQHGHCWSKDKEPTNESSKTELGKLEAPGSFISELTELEDNTTYYVRSYLKYSYGVVYGTELTIKTLKTGLPVVSTDEVGNITLNTAQCGGEATADSGLMVVAKGVCWDTTAIFSIINCMGKTNEGDSLGSFVSELAGLTEGKTYFVKAYATNAKGTAYGDVKMFSTIPITLPELTTLEISAVTINSAQSGGNVTNDGLGTINVRGVVWSLVENPTIEINDGITTDGTGIGAFVSNLTNLQDGTIYYVRSYATNEKGTAYGEPKSFQTIGIGFPVLTTNNVTDVTATTAVCGGNISSSGNGSVTARGICWNLTGTPTLDNNINFTTDGTGIGSFVSSLTGLIEGTQYFVVAYATNETGTSYGEVKSFTTVDINAPSVTTISASNITTSSATAGGNVIDGGGLDVTQRGVCWNISANPTLENSIGQTTDGTGTGSFVSTINGLDPGTVYYYRAYALNIEGTGYGEVKQFTTTGISLPSVTTNTVTNILQTTATSGGNVVSDGNSAVTVRGVCWSTSVNPTITDNHTTNGTGTGIFVSNITGLGSSTTYYVRAYATNGVGTAYGAQVSFVTLPDIILPGVITSEATNTTQTTAVSGGNVTSDGGGAVTARGVCWSTSSNPTLSNSYTTNGSGTGVFISNITGLTAYTLYYVRAYATNEAGTSYGNQITFNTLANPVLPTVTTEAVTDIASTTATSGGNVISDGGANVTVRGICWSTSSNPTISDSHTSDGNGIGSFVSYLTGLNESTTYYVRAYATNSVGTAYGDEVSFATLPPPFQCGQSITYEGQVYNTVEVGTQCWFKENLNVGVYIDGNQEQTDNGQIEKYCYENNIANCNTYGGLYQWNEVMQYVTTQPAQGICPSGWHIPSDAEWKILEGNSDTQYGVGDPEWDLWDARGYDAGKRLKSTLGWDLNIGTNATGFSALPGGQRETSGIFYSIGSFGYWWTANGGHYRRLYSHWDLITRSTFSNATGNSVRCLKD